MTAVVRPDLVRAVTLDEAWSRVESALPTKENGHPLWRYGAWRMRVVGPWDITYDGHRPTWQAIADPYNATGRDGNREIEALGPTPAAALVALAETLEAR